MFQLTGYALPAERSQQSALVQALANYERIDATGGWPAIPGSMEIDWESDARLPVLQARLAAEQYLPSGQAAEVPGLRDAVRRFQSRHGLKPDGRVGPKTLAALNLPASFRVRQIQQNIERWRILPSQPQGHYVLVNTAALTLSLMDGSEAVLGMRIVAGGRRTPTPEFYAQIQGMTLNPSWTVPLSIARSEVLPKLKRSPGYLQANEMAIVGREAVDPYGFGIDWKTVSARNFPYTLRQSPGPGNPLGRIKFEMPNEFDVFLHDTPAKQVFRREDRWLSHGCIRLERPLALAEALSTLNETKLRELIAAETTVRIPFDLPVPVYVGYWTAFVDVTGDVNFRSDVYGRDGPPGFESVQNEKAAIGCGGGQRL